MGDSIVVKVMLAVTVLLGATEGLAAQEGRDTLVVASQLAVPDSLPLTYITQLVPAADGSLYMLDARTEGVLAFGPDGAFRRRIGRRGEGPGELLSPWRLGLLGRDTLWLLDAGRPRVNLYHASTGESLADFGPATWDVAAAGGEPLRPFAVLGDRRVLAFRWAERDVLAEVLAFRVEGGGAPEGERLALLDLRDRSIAAELPTEDGSLQLRNPFSHSDMLAVGPFGPRVAVIRRPRPKGSPAFFTAERRDVSSGVVDTVRVPYEPRPLDTDEVRAWAEELGPVERMVEVGVFPSRAAGVRAVLEALDAPGHYPPVENRGRGIVDEGVLMNPEGGMWFQLYDPSGQTNEWIVVSADGGEGGCCASRSQTVSGCLP